MRLAVLFLALLVPCSASDATTWFVPSQCPTIQAGIDSASAGDTVLVACGTYYDCGHEDPWGIISCVLMKSGVCLRSETGNPNCATVDARYCGRAIACEGVDSTTTIEGLTITGGLWDVGGGVWCYGSSPRIRNCVFLENQTYHGGGLALWESRAMVSDCVFTSNYAEFGGGAISCVQSSSLTVVRCRFMDNAGGAIVSSSSSVQATECLFVENSFQHGGGAVTCGQSTATFSRCTFCRNSSADAGSAIAGIQESTVDIANSIIASGLWMPAVFCGNDGSTVTMTCCDVFGNAGGDWVGCIADQYGISGNISEDPLFCDPDFGDFRLDCQSPCAPAQQPECGLMGVWEVGCEGTAAEKTTWSSLKALYW